MNLSFEEYYEHYLSLHQNKWCRRLHFTGQIATILFVLLVLYKQLFILLIASPFIIYPFAWSGHYMFEKNEPAAFKNPVWAKMCDWLMFRDIILRRIDW
ncbi:MAG TPA: DUF962 domain-containing protein [Flavobacteriaceae bacterium]|jgi:hypothetical protein|nr:DUF962 domain-containing protein [Flavobacteriaceae bacterium]